MGVGPLHSIDEVAEGNEAMEKRERQEGITTGQAKGQTQRRQSSQPNLARVNGAAIYPPRVLSEEPTAVIPHGGICGGESQQWLSYPTDPHVRFDERGVETEPWSSHKGTVRRKGRNMPVLLCCGRSFLTSPRGLR
jgi:hypothetical protein